MLLKSFNLNKLDLLPENWDSQIIEVSKKYSELIHLDGKHITSKEPSETSGMDVFMVYGDIIFEKLNWLYTLYSLDLLSLANLSFGNKYDYSRSLTSAITLNTLKGIGARYELHVDSNPLTGLLFVTTHPYGKGGELVFHENNEQILIHPLSGEFHLFDAREVKHEVLPLKGSESRISIPMNYYFKHQQQPDWFKEKKID